MNTLKKPLIIMKLGVIWFYSFALIAHFLAPSVYRIIDHNMSQLGAQGHPNAYIMQIAFIGSALLWLYGLILNIKQKELHTSVSYMFLGIALMIIVAGIFKTTLDGILPFYTETQLLERDIHLIAAHTSQVLGLIILLEHIKYSQMPVKKIHITVLILLIIFSIIFQFGPFTGITQRVLALTHSYWTLRYLNRY